MDVTKTRASLGKTLAAARVVFVVDSHIPEGIVPKDIVRRVLVLRCHPRILQARLGAKKWNPDKIRENVLAEIVDSCLTAAVRYYGSRIVIQLDTSTGSTRGRVAYARSYLRKRLARRARFDWLTILEKEGELDHYLK